MRLFQCHTCGNLLFFENSACVQCGTQVGLDPSDGRLRSLPAPGLERCSNGAPGCNWLCPVGDGDGRCASCRMTVDHPPVGGPGDNAWAVLERAKRRLLQTLSRLQLDSGGLRFAFPATGLTGHADGLITVVLPEADDAERIRRQHELGEPFRTLIGHFRHESGHFFLPQMIADPDEADRFRALFGDERSDYQAALDRHYREGPPANWGMEFVSAYASAHPHEDWAETWAHYLHLFDALEISAAYGISLAPRATVESRPVTQISLQQKVPDSFDEMLRNWIPLTWFANSLNRSLGHQDWYPLAPAPRVVEKMRYVHELIHGRMLAAQAG